MLGTGTPPASCHAGKKWGWAGIPWWAKTVGLASLKIWNLFVSLLKVWHHTVAVLNLCKEWEMLYFVVCSRWNLFTQYWHLCASWMLLTVSSKGDIWVPSCLHSGSQEEVLLCQNLEKRIFSRCLCGWFPLVFYIWDQPLCFPMILQTCWKSCYIPRKCTLLPVQQKL